MSVLPFELRNPEVIVKKKSKTDPKFGHVPERRPVNELPPVKSAVKRQLREREIYYIDVLEVEGREVLFRMGCQAGTYVRKWCHDVGEKLGVGANMAELVRTKAGPFKAKTMVTLQDV